MLYVFFDAWLAGGAVLLAPSMFRIIGAKVNRHKQRHIDAVVNGVMALYSAALACMRWLRRKAAFFINAPAMESQSMKLFPLNEYIDVLLAT